MSLLREPDFGTPAREDGATVSLTIDSIAPVYLQRVYGGNCSSGGCDITFDPGFGYSTSQSSQKVSAFTAFLFPTGTLPPSLNSPYAPNELGAHRFARLIR